MAMAPSGYMVSHDNNGFSIELCSGAVSDSETFKVYQKELKEALGETDHAPKNNISDICDYNFVSADFALNENFNQTRIYNAQYSVALHDYFLVADRQTGPPLGSRAPPSFLL